MLNKHNNIVAMFYNRVQETTSLRRALSRKRKQFIVLYGRRRCGKSTLLRKVSGKGDVYFLSSQANQNLQREALANLLEDKSPGISSASFNDWDSFFSFLNKATRERFVLILDEFPYLVQSAPELPSIINRYIDNRDTLNFDIVVCGSSQQMMRGLVLSATAPLYGRADEIMKIEPLSAGWLLEHLPKNAPEELVKEFAVWGGIPRYWELRAEYASLAEAVRELVLLPTGIMREEPKRLLLDDMREVTQSISLLTVVALGAHRLSEIAARMRRPATDLSRPLNRLIELGYINKETPYGSLAHRNKTSLYKVADPFIHFYFNLIYPNLSTLVPGHIESSWQRITLKMNQFVSLEWERLCRKAIGLHPMLLSYGFVAGRWWGNGRDGRAMELDIVGTSPDNKFLLVGECKWTQVKNPESLIVRLLAKAQQLPIYNGQEIIPVLTAKEFIKTPSCIHLSPADTLKLLKL